MAYSLKGLRHVCEAAFAEAVRAADPEEAVHRHLRMRGGVLRAGDIDYFMSQFQRVFVIGAGKASVRMARAVEQILGPRITRGVVITTRGQERLLRRVLIREGGHPLPDEEGVRATEELLELVEELSDHDLVICVLSGGGSSLLTAPVEGVSLKELQKATRLMLASGMGVKELNAVRKRLCQVKAGGLAARTYPATMISLILSDVVGDQVEVIASGPTVADAGEREKALEVLRRRGLWEKMPKSVQEALLREEEKAKGGPDEDDPFRRVHNLVVGSNRESLVAAEKQAKRMGTHAMILSSSVSGESREIAHFYAALAREIRRHGSPLRPPACLIGGGETTVTVKGKGRGGRCQEMALALCPLIEEIPGVVFMAAGTDGIDGPTDAAGAVVDSQTALRARKRGLDPEVFLEDNNSYAFFQELADLVTTGPTGTNVMDVHILVVG